MEKITRTRIFFLNSKVLGLKTFPNSLKNLLKHCEIKIRPRSSITSQEINFSNAQTPLSIQKKKKNESFTVPPLMEDYLRNISSVTGVLIGISYISWIKFLIHPTLSIIDWNTKTLPEDFRSKTTEPDILKYAYYLKQALPSSDLYVMETFSIRGKELNERINDIHLSSMLIVLLNGINREPEHIDQVVFQKKKVINQLFDLLVGSERVSSKSVVESILRRFKLNLDSDKNEENIFENDCSSFTSVSVLPKCLDAYKDSSFDKKEDLSTVFLLALSFIEVNIIKNATCLNKLNRKKQKVKMLF